MPYLKRVKNETFATGMVRPKTTALFFDKLWVHPALIKGFDPDDGLEDYRVPAEICVTKPMEVSTYFESLLAQRAYVASRRGEVMHTDVTEALRRLSAETWDLATIFQVESLQHFEGRESPFWSQFRDRLGLETQIGRRAGDWELYLSTSQRNKAIAFIADVYASRGVHLTPIYLETSDFDEASTQKSPSPGLEICLDQIPTPADSKLTWDKVIEFRKDKDAVQKLNRLRLWFTRDLAKKSEAEIRATIEEKLDNYQYALRKHGIETILEGATSLISFIAEKDVLELLTSSPLAAAIGGVALAAGTIAWIGSKLIERSELKRKEAAYIYDVQKLVTR